MPMRDKACHFIACLSQCKILLLRNMKPAESLKCWAIAQKARATRRIKDHWIDGEVRPPSCDNVRVRAFCFLY